MGGGSYSTTNKLNRAVKSYGSVDAFMNTSIGEVFTKRSIESAMNPMGLVVRESRDSEEHPNSLAVIIALDVTGSMGTVPQHLVKEGLPTLMETIINKGIPDPQVLFLGIGDQYVDSAPLQVSQFESSDELLDKWLMDVYLEGGGGGNGGESYALAWYVAANHTSIDCFEKRQQKGFLFTIGDEPVHKEISKNFLKNIIGDGEYQNYTANTLYEKASEKYHVYHIHIKETNQGGQKIVADGWRELLADHLLIANRHTDVADIIAKKILEITGKSVESTVVPVVENGSTVIVEKPMEMML
jgi:hypothetical protein